MLRSNRLSVHRLMRGGNRPLKIVRQFRERTRESLLARDENIVVTCPRRKRQYRRSGCPKTPLCPVPFHRAANLPAGRDADADLGQVLTVPSGRWAHLDPKAPGRLPLALLRAQIFRPRLKPGELFL